MTEEVERERLDVDILFVGAGPATLASVIRLADLCKEHDVEMPAVLVVEKAADLGGHQLSGAVMDPRAIKELFPDFLDQGFPFHNEASKEFVYMLTKNRAFKLPLVPPQMVNHGNLVISVSDVVKWLGEKAEEREIEIYPGFPAAKPLYDGDRVVGVQIQDAGIDKEGSPKGNFEPGPEIYAQCVVFGEGPRGSCTKQVVEKFDLHGTNPQAYETGIKEIWKIDPQKHMPGRIIHTMGWPHDSGTFGGSWVYDMKDNTISFGFVTGLNYESPYTNPHDNMQRLKLHPFFKELLDGGECIRAGAKTIPCGGVFSMPKLQTEGAMLIGDSAGFCNGARLKGVHMALKSGMLAAEALFEAARKQDFSEETLSLYTKNFEESWAYKEHWKYRNFHASFDWTQKMPRWLGMARQLPWLFNAAGVAAVTGGRGLVGVVKTHPDHTHMRKLGQLDKTDLDEKELVAYDNKHTFDKVTAVALAGSNHEVDQPHHLKVADTNVCAQQCLEEYGNPCQSFCPAEVYEMVEDSNAPKGKSLLIHHENCVHCKTCDIADPYEIITWTTPQGGGGPDYTGM